MEEREEQSTQQRLCLRYVAAVASVWRFNSEAPFSGVTSSRAGRGARHTAAGQSQPGKVVSPRMWGTVSLHCTCSRCAPAPLSPPCSQCAPSSPPPPRHGTRPHLPDNSLFFSLLYTYCMLYTPVLLRSEARVELCPETEGRGRESF